MWDEDNTHCGSQSLQDGGGPSRARRWSCGKGREPALQMRGFQGAELLPNEHRVLRSRWELWIHGGRSGSSRTPTYYAVVGESSSWNSPPPRSTLRAAKPPPKMREGTVPSLFPQTTKTLFQWRLNEECKRKGKWVEKDCFYSMKQCNRKADRAMQKTYIEEKQQNSLKSW